MKKGQERFDYFLTTLEALLLKAGKQKNPALWLYRNGARTPLFMLEALAKLYAELHNQKRFTKIKEHFKLLEDSLGAIDYYDVFAKSLSSNKKIPASVITYLQAQTREKTEALNELLVNKKWFRSGKNRISKIREKLADADWLDEDGEITKINAFYGEAIYQITEFMKSRDCRFENMEADVHELRRKLRWLSIYPQAFRGCIQLQTDKTIPKHLVKYVTPEIKNSPFNKMPDVGTNKNLLLLDANYFYALSWMIAELGRLKDEGLQIVAVKEALLQTTGLNDADAVAKAYGYLGKKQPKMQPLLDSAETICRGYFSEHNLEHLVTGAQKLP